jgi:hypothetical protein
MADWRYVSQLEHVALEDRWPEVIQVVVDVYRLRRSEGRHSYAVECLICDRAIEVPIIVPWQRRCEVLASLLSHALEHSARGDRA